MSDDAETDLPEINANYPLEDTVTMLRRGGERDPTNSVRVPILRSLDQFLEDAYQEDSLFGQWKYWMIMVRTCSRAACDGEVALSILTRALSSAGVGHQQ